MQAIYVGSSEHHAPRIFSRTAAMSAVSVGVWRWLSFCHINDADWIEMEEQIASKGPCGASLQFNRTRRHLDVYHQTPFVLNDLCGVQTDAFNNETLTN